MSRIQYGTMRMTCWGANMTVEQGHNLIKKCVELGITTIDTADIYGHYDVEEFLGKIFEHDPELRHKVQIVTKCGICLPCARRPEFQLKHYNSTKSHIISSVENSLKSMRTNFIDVLLIHRPDPLTHPSEIADAFSVLYKNGSVKFFGVSNYTPTQFDALTACLPKEIPLVTNQVEFSLVHVDPLFDGTFDSAYKYGIVPQIWSPFGGGRIFATGTSTSPVAPEILALQSELKKLAEKYHTTPEIIALSWVLGTPASPTVIVGSTNLERVEESVNSLNVKLTRQEWFWLLQVARGREVA